jgi:hypothetical protein
MTFISNNHAAIRRLVDALVACPVGETVTYTELSRALGSPVQERFYLVLAAMRRANEETGANFVNIRTVGYQRQPPALAHIIGATARAKGRRVFKRASRAIDNTLKKANDVSEADRLKAYREQALLGLLRQMTRDRELPPVASDKPPPPIGATVRTSIKLLREHLTAVYG